MIPDFFALRSKIIRTLDSFGVTEYQIMTTFNIDNKVKFDVYSLAFTSQQFCEQVRRSCRNRFSTIENMIIDEINFSEDKDEMDKIKYTPDMKVHNPTDLSDYYVKVSSEIEKTDEIITLLSVTINVIAPIKSKIKSHKIKYSYNKELLDYMGITHTLPTDFHLSFIREGLRYLYENGMEELHNNVRGMRRFDYERLKEKAEFYPDDTLILFGIK